MIALALAHSCSGSVLLWRSLSLSLTHSGSLWLSQALIGSQGPCSAHNAGAWPMAAVYPGLSRVYFELKRAHNGRFRAGNINGNYDGRMVSKKVT